VCSGGGDDARVDVHCAVRLVCAVCSMYMLEIYEDVVDSCCHGVIDVCRDGGDDSVECAASTCCVAV
jgi:hypothetical protein